MNKPRLLPKYHQCALIYLIRISRRRLDQDVRALLPGPGEAHPGQHGAAPARQPQVEVHVRRGLLLLQVVERAARRRARAGHEAAQQRTGEDTESFGGPLILVTQSFLSNLSVCYFNKLIVGIFLDFTSCVS